MTSSHSHKVHTHGQGDVQDLSGPVERAVAESGIRDGITTVFVSGSTAGITAIEFEPGVVSDLARAFEQLAPRAAEYKHHLRWGDDNGSSHVRAGLLGPSLTVPVRGGSLALGTWQQIVLVEFDTRPRTREIVIQIVGEP
jgi:secondary thiamine-phosphate synthase enzyme